MSRQSFYRWIVVIVSAFSLIFWSCSSRSSTGPDNQQPPNPTTKLAKFSAIQANVFNTKCAFSGCHNSASQASGLDLSEGKAYSNLVNVPSQEVPQFKRVAPGNPNQSYLVMKLEGSSGIQGARMPRGGSPLSQATIDSIKKWIADGAPNN